MTARPSPPGVYGIDLGIALDQRRVLVADHSAFNRRTLARFLNWAGIRDIEFAATGSETLAKVESFNPDLLLLDVVLPEIDGIEVLKRIRQDRLHADIPVLVQTTLVSDALRTLCYQAGATDILAKPVNPGECIARVRYHLERLALIQELRQFRERIEKELKTARDMQLSLAPERASLDALAQRHNVSIDVFFESSEEIGGDFWSVFEIDSEHIGIVAADFSGHGITAAINTFRLHTLIGRLAPGELRDPGATLTICARRLYELLPLGQFATAFYGVLHSPSGELTYATAGAPSPLLFRQGTPEMIDASGLFLGVTDDEVYPNEKLVLEPGNHLFLYSDALVETRDDDGQMLGEDGLGEMATRAIDVAPLHPLGALLTSFSARFQGKVDDDQTAIWIRRN
ncbi:MAG: SpoIIE family protein phosphatase [Azospirillaceae bacterium]|nr:SpoIIE family protein phosphatase [Azospirillaceae bacterium]